jgi:dienelactone hydrolase
MSTAKAQFGSKKASIMSSVIQKVRIPLQAAALDGDLQFPKQGHGMVVFAHGSGSSRHSPRNRLVADELAASGLGTLLLDLLTPAEEQIDRQTRHLRFDINLLANRLIDVIDWLPRVLNRQVRTGLFGASTGAAAALLAAAARARAVHAVVSRGGRPDLAEAALPHVKAPTLLIVGGTDHEVIRLNQYAFDRLGAAKQIEIIPGAGHLFEEGGALEQVAMLARDWFVRYLGGEV